MGRLNSIGSSKTLRRVLFPHGFAGEVMRLVFETWNKFSAPSHIRLEECITAIFMQALVDAYIAAGRNWFIVPEHPITDPNFGTQLGRNDLRFYLLDYPGQKVFFPLECKRLRVRTTSSFKHLADEYVKEGMQRFVDGKYSAEIPCGGMLGYVMDNQVDDSLASVQAEIEKYADNLKMKKKRPLCCPSSVLPSHRCSMDTFHRRSDGELTIHHLLVGIQSK
jgi:hypothetical protein